MASPRAWGSRGCLTFFDNRWNAIENFESVDGRITCEAITWNYNSTLDKMKKEVLKQDYKDGGLQVKNNKKSTNLV